MAAEKIIKHFVKSNWVLGCLSNHAEKSEYFHKTLSISICIASEWGLHWKERTHISIQCNPRTLKPSCDLFSSNTPGKAGTHLQLSKRRPWLLPHPRVGLECRFGALSSLIKSLSSHTVIKYQKEAAPRITGPGVVIWMDSPRWSPIQLLTQAHVA